MSARGSGDDDGAAAAPLVATDMVPLNVEGGAREAGMFKKDWASSRGFLWRILLCTPPAHTSYMILYTFSHGVSGYEEDSQPITKKQANLILNMDDFVDGQPQSFHRKVCPGVWSLVAPAPDRELFSSGLATAERLAVVIGPVPARFVKLMRDCADGNRPPRSKHLPSKVK